MSDLNLESVRDKDVPYYRDLSSFTTTDLSKELLDYMFEFAPMNIAISLKANPSIKKMHDYCVDFIAKLWNAPESCLGIATVGSSEACIMAAASMLSCWKKSFKGVKNESRKPNLILSSAYQICWKKFSKYFDVELREIPVTEKKVKMQVDKLDALIDEYTIGVIGMFGNTQAGLYDDIEAINDIIEENNNRFGRNIKIHVDAASGGFFAPFIQPDKIFDFRLKNIASINASGHKYGLTPPSIGWLIFKNKDLINTSFCNTIDYLGGGVHEDIGINFSKSAMPLAAQYYLFNHLGFSGYKEIISKTDGVAQYIADEINKIPQIELVTKGNISTVIYTSSKDSDLDLRLLEKELRETYRWHIPTYELPDINTLVHRIVVRTDLKIEKAKELITDIKNILQKI